jgi:molecular chaperone DnaK (HSP70)
MSFGIDFGTANSVLAQFDGKEASPVPLDKWNLDDWQYPSFENLFPTVVGYSSTRPEPLFGWEAKLRSEESFAAVKRLLKGDERVRLHGRDYTAPTVVAAFFNVLRSRAAEEQGLAVGKAVVTVPANAIGSARFRTRAAARVGGIQVQALLNEPTAAAIAYVHDMEDTADRLLVFDWGGGTVDVTVLQYDHEFRLFVEEASRGITELGGRELDARLERLVLRKIGGNPGWSDSEVRQFGRDIERTKIRLSTEEFVTMTTPDFSRVIEIERAEFEAEINDLIMRSSEPLRSCLSDLGIGPDQLDAVLMIGGSSQIPLVRASVETILDTETVDPEVCDPMTAVARGAAIAAAILDGDLDSELCVATTHALGTVSTKNGHRKFSQIIPRNAMLPRVESKFYKPTAKDPSAIVLEVWEGDPEKPLDNPENFLLAEVRVDLPQGRAGQDNTFKLTYTYNTDGLLHMKVETEDGHRLLDEDVEKFGVKESGANVTPESLREFLDNFSVL